MLYMSMTVCLLVVGAALSTPERVQDEHEHAALEKRSPHYDFGLGKRAYSYVSEYKRLPVYNFGLGKRYCYFMFICLNATNL